MNRGKMTNINCSRKYVHRFINFMEPPVFLNNYLYDTNYAC